MKITLCTKADFDQILRDVSDFWGSDRTLHLHQPSLYYEFGNSAYVIKNDNKVIAYLFGFLSQTGPTAYVHLVAVRQTHQHQGLGHHLYNHFCEFAKENGCEALKAITTVTNKASINFHKSLGMELLGELDEEAGIPIVRDYGGIGNHRVVFHKSL